jgi:hypothetical protein
LPLTGAGLRMTAMSVCLSRFSPEIGKLHERGGGVNCLELGIYVVIGTYCCATVTSDHISEAVTCVIWHEERHWNVSVLQREHLSYLEMLHVRFQCLDQVC